MENSKAKLRSTEGPFCSEKKAAQPLHSQPSIAVPWITKMFHCTTAAAQGSLECSAHDRHLFITQLRGCVCWIPLETKCSQTNCSLQKHRAGDLLCCTSPHLFRKSFLQIILCCPQVELLFFFFFFHWYSWWKITNQVTKQSHSKK